VIFPSLCAQQKRERTPGTPFKRVDEAKALESVKDARLLDNTCAYSVCMFMNECVRILVLPRFSKYLSAVIAPIPLQTLAPSVTAAGEHGRPIL
jgi:hypothetical protein